MKEITITKWEAFDGAVFDDDSKCIEYENDRLAHLAEENGIIFLDRNREKIVPCEVEHCEYLYVPDGKAYDLILQIFDMFELYSPFSAPYNNYDEHFYANDPDILGWWVFDVDREIWHNLRLEMQTAQQITTDLKQRTGVA